MYFDYEWSSRWIPAYFYVKSILTQGYYIYIDTIIVKLLLTYTWASSYLPSKKNSK